MRLTARPALCPRRRPRLLAGLMMLALGCTGDPDPVELNPQPELPSVEDPGTGGLAGPNTGPAMTPSVDATTPMAGATSPTTPTIATPTPPPATTPSATSPEPTDSVDAGTPPDGGE